MGGRERLVVKERREGKVECELEIVCRRERKWCGIKERMPRTRNLCVAQFHSERRKARPRDGKMMLGRVCDVPSGVVAGGW